MPLEYHIAFLLEQTEMGDVGVKAWITQLEESIAQDPLNESLQEKLFEVCRLVLAHNKDIQDEPKTTWRERSFPDDIVGLVVVVGTRHERLPLAAAALSAQLKLLPLEVYAMIGSSVSKHGVSAIIELYA
jgi:hypothetical protein